MINKIEIENQDFIISEELPDYNRREIVRPSRFLNQKASFNEAMSKPIDFTEIYRDA